MIFFLPGIIEKVQLLQSFARFIWKCLAETKYPCDSGIDIFTGPGNERMVQSKGYFDGEKNWPDTMLLPVQDGLIIITWWNSLLPGCGITIQLKSQIWLILWDMGTGKITRLSISNLIPWFLAVAVPRFTTFFLLPYVFLCSRVQRLFYNFFNAKYLPE